MQKRKFDSYFATNKRAQMFDKSFAQLSHAALDEFVPSALATVATVESYNIKLRPDSSAELKKY